MPPRNLMRGFLALWFATGLIILILSAETLRTGLIAAPHGDPHSVLLGGVEAMAASLFLIPRTMRVGAAGLLTTIGVALAVHATLGQFRGDLVVYAVVVLFVALHGPLTAAQLRFALTRRTADGG